MFGYVIGIVTEMMNVVDVQSSEYETKYGQIKLFVNDRNFPAPLARRIKTHFSHLYHRTTVFDDTLGDISENLPATMACATVYGLHRDLVESFQFLRNNPPLFVKDLLLKMTPFIAQSDECIARSDTWLHGLFSLEMFGL